MPKFCVSIIKDVWERADIEVEAANREEAEARALALVKSDDDAAEEIDWHYDQTNSYDAVAVHEVKETTS